MFALIRRWRQRRTYRRQYGQAFEQREIFSYWDGEKERRADPLAVARALDHHPRFDAAKHFKAMEEGDNEAAQIILETIREVFGLQAWSESTPGLTEEQTLSLLERFVAYVNSSRAPAEAAAEEPAEAPAEV